MGWYRSISKWIVGLLVLTIALIVVTRHAGRELPVGREIAYVSKLSPEVWDVFVMDIDRGLAYNLTQPFMNRPIRNRLPAWSPDGLDLVWVTEINRQMDILLMNTGHERLRFLADRHFDETAPTWAAADAGARRVAYAAHNGLNWDIYVRRVDQGNILLVQTQAGRPFIGGYANDTMPLWSPDGRWLLFLSDRNGQPDLYMVASSGRGFRRLTTDMNVEPTVNWSPDGKQIAFVSARDGNREIYLIDVETGTATNLTQNPANDFDPAWSPDGSRLAFVSDRDGDDELFVIKPNGEQMRRITNNYFDDFAPVWSPDGRALLYTAVTGFTSEIYVADVARNHVRRLTYDTVDDWYPVWRP